MEFPARLLTSGLAGMIHMSTQNPLTLAAELRARAALAKPEEQRDLLFLAAEYERLAKENEEGDRGGTVNVRLPE